MNQKSFELLCTQACEVLAIEDSAALGCGMDVWYDGVLLEMMFADGQTSALVMVDLGEIAADDRQSVCESLLAMQLGAWDDPHVRFGYHPLRDAMVLCVNVALDEAMGSPKLAALLTGAALQVKALRESQLGGMVIARRESSAPALIFPDGS